MIKNDDVLTQNNTSSRNETNKKKTKIRDKNNGEKPSSAFKSSIIASNERVTLITQGLFVHANNFFFDRSPSIR